MKINNYSVSVCMATYNGEKFVGDQIKSIINQFSNNNDELIIVDDNSKDNTVKIIEDFDCPQIVLLRNKSNIGVIKTFEKSIKRAKNPLIFLSDQDDIWMPHKISVYKTAFSRNENIDLLYSDHFLVDHNAKLIGKTFLDKQMPLKIPIPIFNTRCHGPGLAFSQRAKNIILPFPKKISSHDKWIAITLSLLGRVKFITVACQFYRIHSKQVCSIGIKGRRPLDIIIKSRLNMLINLFKRSLEYYLFK
ncbi:MAG: glycosyltransferase [Prochlorococcus marinus XMU1428]|nr:glycosyltransferase [Prochlorococcus marinus XMU1428]